MSSRLYSYGNKFVFPVNNVKNEVVHDITFSEVLFEYSESSSEDLRIEIDIRKLSGFAKSLKDNDFFDRKNILFVINNKTSNKKILQIEEIYLPNKNVIKLRSSNTYLELFRTASGQKATEKFRNFMLNDLFYDVKRERLVFQYFDPKYM